jgi:hypothetical protein
LKRDAASCAPNLEGAVMVPPGQLAEEAFPRHRRSLVSLMSSRFPEYEGDCFFAVDTRVLRCYNAGKDKLFGGESPNELQNAVRE